jgi:hypothetical protein
LKNYNLIHLNPIYSFSLGASSALGASSTGASSALGASSTGASSALGEDFSFFDFFTFSIEALSAISLCD